MEGQTETTPIIFFVDDHSCGPYNNTSLTCYWTSKFAESVKFRHLTFLPPKMVEGSYDSLKSMTSVIALDRVPSNLALRPYDYHDGPGESRHKFQWFTDSDDENILVNSLDISLDLAGGHSYLKFHPKKYHLHGCKIQCCVRPTQRCCVNDMPEEILDNIFIYLGSDRYGSSNVTKNVCKLWDKLAARFEVEPEDWQRKLFAWNRLSVQRLNWTTFYYRRNFPIGFHEYLDNVVRFQPNLEYLEIDRPSDDFKLEDLVTLAKVPTIKIASVRNWKFGEVFYFLRARGFALQELRIYNISDVPSNSEDDEPSFRDESQMQLIKVKKLNISPINNSIHTILDCFQNDYFQHLELVHGNDTSEILKKSIRFFGFKNVRTLRLDGGNHESNLISPDFITMTCTPWNLPDLCDLSLKFCYIDPIQVLCLLDLPALKWVDITLFMDQKTEENEQVTNYVMERFNSKGIQGHISYGDGDQSEQIDFVLDRGNLHPVKTKRN